MKYVELMAKKLPKSVTNHVFDSRRYGLLLGRAWTNLAKILGHDSGMVWLIVIQISSSYDKVCPNDWQKTAKID